MKKVAINGFGRIGRKVLYNYLTDTPEKIEIVAVNDPNPTEELAYLMKYDSVHGRAPFPVEAGADRLRFGSHEVRVLHERDPARLPWKDLGVEMVLECTGRFTERARSAKHLEAGASRVVISAPSPDADQTVVLGVNEGEYDPAKHTVISNASCTTNALAPAAKVLNDTFGVERLMATAIHAYTATQANDQAALEAVAAQWRKEYNAPGITVASVLCDGCLSGPNKCGHCGECDIRACGVQRGVANCAHCPDYACDKLQRYFDFAPQMQTMLDQIHQAL